MRTSYTILGS